MDNPLHAALLLSLRFDPDRLREDLSRLPAEDWIPHFNTGDYDGDWSGLALRGPANGTHPIQALHSPPGETGFRNLAYLDDCPDVRDLLRHLECPLGSVRLLRLSPGAVIAEHSDHELGYGFGEVRLHVPILTNPGVDFRIDGERVRMDPGELWYIDASRPHSVANHGAQPRVHLVIDCRVNSWLDKLLELGVVRYEPRPLAAEARPTPLRTASATGPIPDQAVAGRIRAFLKEIGVVTQTRALPDDTFLPGIRIEHGKLVFDPGRLAHAGDLLHEAGHIAVAPAAGRPALNGEAGGDPAEEMMAIAWSWAAICHLGLDPAVVFHPGGYKGDSQWLIETFRGGNHLALPMLQWIGLTMDAEHAKAAGVEPYPHMLRWLRE